MTFVLSEAQNQNALNNFDYPHPNESIHSRVWNLFFFRIATPYVLNMHVYAFAQQECWRWEQRRERHVPAVPHPPPPRLKVYCLIARRTYYNDKITVWDPGGHWSVLLLLCAIVAFRFSMNMLHPFSCLQDFFVQHLKYLHGSSSTIRVTRTYMYTTWYRNVT